MMASLQQPWGSKSPGTAKHESCKYSKRYRQGWLGKSVWTRGRNMRSYRMLPWDSIGWFFVWCGDWGWRLPGRTGGYFPYILYAYAQFSTERFKTPWYEEVSHLLWTGKAITSLMLCVHMVEREAEQIGGNHRLTVASSPESHNPQSLHHTHWNPKEQNL